ncbi:MAG TPA: DNA helicase II [Desulfobacteraceae bacterium]|nr:DNA helicase II [Desulfobacteraceae bacterium]
MRYRADLHIHSPFSRATSKAGTLHGLAAWAGVKGIDVVGTGDFTHPGWQRQISGNLEEAEPGFFRLKDPESEAAARVLPPGLEADPGGVRFVLSAEISSIYKKDGRVRKVHTVLFVPDMDSVRRISATLSGIGNLESDGRPILGLDCRDLLEILLENAPEGFLVPAHVWTPWFSLFGSRSGFDAIEECFGDLTGHIFALETGLSSDPDMNRLISALDRFSLISNSDCHSPAKLGREANIFTTGFDFYSLRDGLREPVDAGGRQRFAATVEFYPEEGKYHLDGHRKCGISLEPAETRRMKGICPVCGNPLTVGVLSRVMELADRERPRYTPGAPAVFSLVPLPELLGELLGTGPASKRVSDAYVRLIRRFGSELDILLETDTAALAAEASPLLAEAVARVRTGRVIRSAGYDGAYGTIRVFSDQERKEFGGQMQLFPAGPARTAAPAKKNPLPGSDPPGPPVVSGPVASRGLNPEQEKAVAAEARHILVNAGPGTGKTHTLVQRVVRHVRQGRTPCTVITFTNRAADELRQRLDAELGGVYGVIAATFHGYCLLWLRRATPNLQAAGPELRRFLLGTLHPQQSSREIAELDGDITSFLQSAPDTDVGVPAAMAPYFERLASEQLIDLEAVAPAVLAFLKRGGPAAEVMRRETGRLFIDEFQDLNRSQYELVRLLAATVPVFSIGDPDQAIYGFRGSSPGWFFQFIHDLQPEQHALYRNYRNDAVIVRAAGAVISRNRRRGSAGQCESLTGRTGVIYSMTADSPRAEAAAIVREIEAVVGGTSHREIDRIRRTGHSPAALSDIAVLYRTGRQAGIIAEALIEHGFPVQVVDLIPYYRTGPAHPLYLWTLLAAGLEESSDLLALMGKEKGGSQATAAAEQCLAGVIRTPMAVLLRNREEVPAPLQAVLIDMASTVEMMRETARTEGVVAALRGLLPRYGTDPAAGDVIRLLSLADNFGASLEAFALHLRHYSDTVIYDERAEAVTLMTLHASKGLEFKIVFIAGVEEGLLPLLPKTSFTGAEEMEHVEEERRLFYVGMTRAKEILYLSRAEKRSLRGGVVRQEPSRFIAEIPAPLITPLQGRKTSGTRKSRAQQLSLFE